MHLLRLKNKSTSTTTGQKTPRTRQKPKTLVCREKGRMLRKKMASEKTNQKSTPISIYIASRTTGKI
jgi:hypothetical protein